MFKFQRINCLSCLYPECFQRYSLVLQKFWFMGIFDDLFNDSFSDDLEEGKDFYMEKGYRVMTEAYLTNRGYCCANGCRHCPYWPKAQKGNTRLRKDA